MNKNIKEFLEFIKNSPSCFHAINNIQEILLKDGYIELFENKPWELVKGGKYFLTRNQSSVIAFSIPMNLQELSFNISASHSDSPTFKVKPNFELQVSQKYIQLNTEVYGGPIFSTWLDRPLSIAGRVMVKSEEQIKMKLLNINEDLLVIPNVAPHMNPQVNSGMTYNPQNDLVPLFSDKRENGILLEDLIAKALNISKDEIISHDLFLYLRDRGHLTGANKEFIMAPQLDDLECAFGCLKGFIEGENEKSINVYCCFDNEEVGSMTKQGAASNLLKVTLERISKGLKLTEEDLHCALANSLMISADNAHAVHPNSVSKSDALNRCFMNEGIVIKYNANQRYTTDAVSASLFKSICKSAAIPVQEFTNRSDIRGGGTLGSISTSQVSINSVDIGLAQLAMHSAMETAGVDDLEVLIKGLTAFYSSHIVQQDGKNYSIK